MAASNVTQHRVFDCRMATAQNRREAVLGVKALLLQDLGAALEAQWANERDYTTNVVRGAKAESAFPDFIARKGRAT